MGLNRKKTMLIILTIVCLILILYVIYTVGNKEEYASDDPLYGSFLIENKVPSDEIYPADFLVSIDVATSDETLNKYAKKSNVDISKGSWVYSFNEKNNQIGTFEYSYKKFLWIEYNKSYVVDWRGTSYELNRTMQGFAFP